MVILGLETSCDETSAAVLEGKEKPIILSNIVATSLPLHTKTGGIIPENAARQQVNFMIPVIEKALKESRTKLPDIDAIAVTYGPGLIGSLLVGVETAKTLSYVFKKPIIPINHLIGHIYANFVDNSEVAFPAIALVVSGGHTDLVLMRQHGSIEWLGGTRDDAAGEAFDKIGRLLNLPYPAGPIIEKLAKKGNPKAFPFPRPLIDSQDFDFSFSGLKTAVFRSVILRQKAEESRSFANAQDDNFVYNVSASVQQAIIDVLISKTLKAAKKYKVKSILLGGGVAANQKLRDDFELNAKRYLLDAEIFCPPKNLCTDNAAMIAAAALYNFNPVHFSKVTANPQLYFD